MRVHLLRKRATNSLGCLTSDNRFSWHHLHFDSNTENDFNPCLWARDHHEQFTQSLSCIILMKMREKRMRTERTLFMDEIGRRQIHNAATDTSKTNIFISSGAHPYN